METMSVASVCGCIRRYIGFLILLIPIYIYSSCICSFLQQHPYFLLIFKLFFVLVSVIFAIYSKELLIIRIFW